MIFHNVSTVRMNGGYPMDGIISLYITIIVSAYAKGSFLLSRNLIPRERMLPQHYLQVKRSTSFRRTQNVNGQSSIVGCHSTDECRRLGMAQKPNPKPLYP